MYLERVPSNEFDGVPNALTVRFEVFSALGRGVGDWLSSGLFVEALALWLVRR